MIERDLTVRSLSPLALHDGRSRAQFTPGLDYIPGSALRGAAAAHYLRTYGKDEAFHALFVADQSSFADLLPAMRELPGRLLPATACLCKRHGWDHTESLTDSLLRLALVEEMENTAPVDDVRWKHCPAPDCGQERDRAAGYATPNNAQIKVTSRLLTGTSIHRATGMVESGMLFSQEVLGEGQFFRGTVRIAGGEEAAGGLRARLEALLPVGERLRVGAARSRGLGLVEVTDWRDPWAGLSLDSRWSQFKRAMAALWKAYEAKPGEACFSITLESDLLLRDPAQRPITRLAEQEDVAELIGLEGVTLSRHVLRPTTVRGWNAQQGLPKETEPALGRGSVLFFRITTADEAAVRQQLAAIEAEGLGRRRSEGFGRVRVCDPFHYTFVLQEMKEANR